MVDEPEKSDSSALFATKTLMLEGLVAIVFAELFKTSPTPIKTAQDFAENMRARLESYAAQTSQKLAGMHLVEAYNVFWEDVIARLRAEGIKK